MLFGTSDTLLPQSAPPSVEVTVVFAARALRFVGFGACRGGALPEIGTGRGCLHNCFSVLRILCSHRALRPRLKCTVVFAARALRFVGFGACRGGALPKIETGRGCLHNCFSVLRILCSHRALRPRLKCTVVFAARALRFVGFGACRGGALPEIETGRGCLHNCFSVLRILCSHRALRPRLKCTAVFAARALRFVGFGACRGGALPEIETGRGCLHNCFSVLRILCSHRALRPRLKCTVVFAARALRFVGFKHPKRLRISVVSDELRLYCGNCSAPTPYWVFR